MIREIGGPVEALPVVKNFVHDHWWHARASITLGGLFLEMGDLPQAEEAFRHASMLDVHDPEALNLIALLDVRQNKLEHACQTQRRAVARQPDQPRQYLILSDILTRMGREDEACETLAHASRLNDGAPQVPELIPSRSRPFHALRVDFARCAVTIGALPSCVVCLRAFIPIETPT